MKKPRPTFPRLLVVALFWLTQGVTLWAKDAALSAVNPLAPVRLGGYDTPGLAYGVQVVGNLAFRLALQRPPEPSERVLCVRLAAQRSLPELCRALLNLNEFAYVD
jgi:hypothetical protein